MRNITSILLLGLSLSLYACGNGDNAHVKSNPIDSSNAYGTAPVDYNKADTQSMLPDADQGEGNRVNTPGGDSAPAATHQR